MSPFSYVLIAILAGVANAEPEGITDACSLVTPADVRATLGRSVPQPRRQHRKGVATCAYVDAPRTVIAVIDVFTLGEAQAREVFALNGLNPRVQSVSGVGDDAAWNPDMKALSVVSRNYLLGIRGVVALEAAKKLADVALSRLP